jgi:hypothetical protein
VELGKVLGVDMRRRIELYRGNPNNPQTFEGLNQSTSEMFRTYLQG